MATVRGVGVTVGIVGLGARVTGLTSMVQAIANNARSARMDALDIGNPIAAPKLRLPARATETQDETFNGQEVPRLDAQGAVRVD